MLLLNNPGKVAFKTYLLMKLQTHFVFSHFFTKNAWFYLLKYWKSWYHVITCICFILSTWQEHFFSDNEGFIEYRFKNIRQKGKQGKKRKHAKSDDHQQEDVMVDEELLQDEDVREKVWETSVLLQCWFLLNNMWNKMFSWLKDLS